MTYTPISWNGTVYRSPLDLRWARFLDCIDVSFIYEPPRINWKLFDFELCGTTIVAEARSAINLHTVKCDADKLFALLQGQKDLAMLAGAILRWHYPCSLFPIPQLGWIRMRDNPPLISDTTWSPLLAFEHSDSRIGLFRAADPGKDLLSGELLPQGRGAFDMPMRRQDLWKLWNRLGRVPAPGDDTLPLFPDPAIHRT